MKTIKRVTQISTISALMAGIFKGDFPVSTLRSHGNLGLGCSDHMDGELIIDQGQFYVAREQVPLRLINDSECLPFVQLVVFSPGPGHRLNGGDIPQLTQHLTSAAGTKNDFIAFRISGLFETVTLRRMPAHKADNASILEITQHQEVETLHQVQGTAIGFFTPTHMGSISVPGVHVHFIDASRICGGHILSMTLGDVMLEQETFRAIDILFPENKAFEQADLTDSNMLEIIKKVER